MTSADTRLRPVVRQATAKDLSALIELMAVGFSRSSLGPHLIADESLRRLVLRRYFRIVVPHAMTYGQVDVLDDGRAAAIWDRVDGPRTATVAGYTVRLAQATGPFFARFAALHASRTEHHPTDWPHHHLTYLAVLPTMRHHGLGTRLLEHHHQRLDNAGLSAFVQAAGSQVSRWFARHGYTPGEPFTSSPGAPPLHPMWRHPRKEQA